MSNADGGVTPSNTDGGTNAAEQKQDQPKALTMADLEGFFKEHLPKVVNSAVTNQLGRVRKDIDAKFEALKPKPAAEAAEGAGDGDAEEREAEPAKQAVSSATATATDAAAKAEAARAAAEAEMEALLK